MLHYTCDKDYDSQNAIYQINRVNIYNYTFKIWMKYEIWRYTPSDEYPKEEYNDFTTKRGGLSLCYFTLNILANFEEGC